MVDVATLPSIFLPPRNTIVRAVSYAVSSSFGGTVSDIRPLIGGARQIMLEPVMFPSGIFLPALFWSDIAAIRMEDRDEAEKHIDEFYLRRSELLPRYEGRYVAFRDGRVLDSDTDRVTLARRFYGTYGYIPVCISKVADKRRVVRGPAPRRKR